MLINRQTRARKQRCRTLGSEEEMKQIDSPKKRARAESRIAETHEFAFESNEPSAAIAAYGLIGISGYT